MELNNLKELLEHKDTTITLYFTRKISKTQDYISYVAAVKEDISNSLLKMISNYVNNLVLESTDVVSYNPTGVADGTYELINTSDLIGYEEYEKSIDDANSSDDLENEADNLNFYTILLTNTTLDKTYKLIRRVTKFKRLYSNGLVAYFKGEELNKINERMIGLDGQIDIIAHENELLLLNHIAVERVFFMDETFNSKATELLRLVKKGDYLTNFDDFEEVCLNDKRIQRTITKMADENIDWEDALKNFNQVMSTIDMFDLNIEYNQVPKNTLIFESKNQVMPILNLIRDSYYKTLINNQLGTDQKIG